MLFRKPQTTAGVLRARYLSALDAIPIPGAKETQEVRDEAAKLRRAEQGKPEPGD